MDAGVFGLALFDRGGRAEGRKVMPLLGAPARRLLCAWAAAAPLFMLQSCLGLGFDLNRSQVTFEGPCCLTFLARSRCAISPLTERRSMSPCAAPGCKSWSNVL